MSKVTLPQMIEACERAAEHCDDLCIGYPGGLRAAAATLRGLDRLRQLTPSAFIESAKRDPHAVGIPTYYAIWPNSEAP